MPPRGSQAQHSGCRVSGMWLNAAGQPATGEIRFVPLGGGRGSGSDAPPGRSAGNVQYSTAPVRVRPDELGRWSVVLAPSRVVGGYRVVFGGRPAVETRIVVPEAAAAEYAEIVQEG